MNIITINDKKYPKLLREIQDPPKQLYYKGKWPPNNIGRASPQRGGDPDIFENCLAVVGSRRMTTYGRQAVERIVTEVAAAGVTIVSGFMYGVDAAAHKAALRAGGRTIAVMPCGIDLIHPEYQQDLYVEILDNKGLIISEYEGSFLPTNWTYPRRNRIVAGLSKAALIIEAGEKSGSLITANFAKKFKRKVFAVPGPITSENSKGVNQLIKEGAELATSAKDILDFYKIKSKIKIRSEEKEKEPGNLEKKIMDLLKKEPLGIDDLARVFRIPASEAGVTLSMMQLKGLIRQEGSKFYLT